MSLNPSIILAGANPDILGAMSRGNELAAQTNTLRDQNALRQVYQTQGAGLLQGNQSSLNALAAIDPVQALNVQGGVMQNRTAQRQFEIMNAQEKRAIAEAAAQMDERQAAAALKAAQQEVLRFVMAPDAATFDQMVTQAGRPQFAGMFDQRERLGSLFMEDFNEAFKTAVGGAPANLPDSIVALEYRAEQAGLRKGTPEYAAFMERGGSTPTPPASVEVNLPGQDKLDDEFAKLDAQNLNQIGITGQAAIRNIGRIDRLDQLLQSGGSGAGAALQRLAGEIGLDLGEGTSDIQAAQAIINSLVPEQRQPGSGPMSDADLALFKQSLPRIINQPGGNAIILQTMRGIAEYDAEGARIVQQYRSGKIDRATAFDMLQNRPNPLDGFAPPSGAEVPPPAAQPQAAPDGNIPPAFLANPSAKAAAERTGVSVEELWEYLSPEVRGMMSQ